MKFNAADLDPELFLLRASAEAEEIYSKPSSAHGRSKQKILELVLYGHAAEVYLIQHKNFKDDLRPYKDVIDPEGNCVEVKVTEGEHYVQFVLDRANKAKGEEWRKFPEILYIFIGDKNTADYELYNIYFWNGKKFSVQTS